MSNIRIPVNLRDGKNITFNLEQDFNSLDILSMNIGSTDIYSRMSSDYGVLVGRVNINGGFGVENVKVSVFVPISSSDRERPEITKLYPFTSINDSYPNGVRYNLLPRIKRSNPSHKPVGTFPTISDLTHHKTYVEVYEKYYKFTTTTNSSGDYMIYGVPLGVQTVHIDFDLFDTKSFKITANDLAYTTSFYQKLKDDDTDLGVDPNQIEGFRYFGNGQYEVTPKTDLDSMPNIFSENKQVNIVPFWGDENFTTIGITRCDFSIDYELRPTAIFFGSVLGYNRDYLINPDYKTVNFGNVDPTTNEMLPNMSNGIETFKNLKLVVYSQNQETKEFGSVQRLGVFDAIEDGSGVFKVNLPMYDNYYVTNEFGQIIPSEEEGVGIPTTGRYCFELFEADEVNSGRRGNPNEGYRKRILPGFRVPANNDGDKFLGGWRRTWSNDSVFRYDIKAARQRYYTIQMTYQKHQQNNLLNINNGDSIEYLPRQIKNSNYQANYPLDINNLPENATIIGSAILPRFSLNFERLANNQVKLNGAERLLSVPYVSTSQSNGIIIRNYEYYLGIGVTTDGTNNIGIWDELFGDGTINNSQPIDGFNFGDNPANGIPTTPHTYSTLLATNENSIAYGVQEELLEAFEVHPHYNFAISDTNTTIVTVSSIEDNQKQKLIEFGIVDITNDLPDLLSNNVYSSYNGLDNKFNNKYYLFGKENNQNALWWLAQETDINE